MVKNRGNREGWVNIVDFPKNKKVGGEGATLSSNIYNNFFYDISLLRITSNRQVSHFM
tara:strand:- start:4293 stop:4466 length:174 start_codon:yes stop_codon:yes gene_type:complete